MQFEQMDDNDTVSTYEVSLVQLMRPDRLKQYLIALCQVENLFRWIKTLF